MIDENLFHLYCFSVVAKYLNYTEAAEKLHMTQPALSKIVKTLENNLGVELFYRNTRKVVLTQAGRLFLDRTVELLNDWDNLVKETVLLAHGKSGKIRVGFLPYAYSDIIPLIIRRFRKENPEVVVQWIDEEENQLENMLKNGKLDVAFVSDWGTDFPDSFVKKTVFREQYYVVVDKNHPLAGREYVTMEMLRNEHFLVLNQENGPRLEGDIGKNRVIELCSMYGFLPNIVVSNQAKTLLGLCVLVAAGEGIAILASSMEKYTEEDYLVAFIPIRGLDIHFSAIMCYSRENQNHCIHKLVDIVDDIMK